MKNFEPKDNLMVRARETIRQQVQEIFALQQSVKQLEKVINKLQSDNEKIRLALKEAVQERDHYLKAYQASRLESDVTETNYV